MNNNLRVVLCAYSEVGCVCMEELIKQGAQILALFTHEDNPWEKIWFRSVEKIALEHGIPVFKPDNINTQETIEQIRSLQPDVLFSFYYRNMICQEVLDIPQMGSFNMHGSLLPKYRGRVPVNWAIIHGEKETGATLHYMVSKPDAGDIVDQEAVAVDFEDTAETLFSKVCAATHKIMARMYPRFVKRDIPCRPQDHAKATYFGGRKPADGQIDWSQSAIQIYNLVRAVTHPYPGAFTYRHGKKLLLWKAYPMKSGSYSGEPGEVLTLNPLVVATGEGALRLDSVQLEDCEEVIGQQFGEQLIIGEKFTNN